VSTGSSPIRVLLVEDTDHVRRMLADLLDADGFAVVGAAAGADEALALLDAADPDVVVVDQILPGIDGLALAEQIRRRRPAQLLVLHTAFLGPEVEARATLLAVDACVAKADGIEALEHEIARIARG
jgi:CheY-like chemotaxis protein